MINLANDSIGILIHDVDHSRWPNGISIFKDGDKWRLDLVTSDNAIIVTDRFDYLYEALDSLTGIVKTLEKEIER